MSEPLRESEIGEARSRGAKFIDGEWVYPKDKKKKMAKKMSRFDAMIHPDKAHPNSPLGKLYGLTKNSFFKKGMGGSGHNNVPPGHKEDF